MRLHVPSLPWTQTTADYLTCAYTQKVVKFAQMMESLGHEVVLYSGEWNEAPCSEHVMTVTDAEQLEWFGPHDPNDPWTKVGWSPSDVWWRTMNARVVAHLTPTFDPRTDKLCLISGWCQRPIVDALPGGQALEWGIGYEGVCLDDHLCFESNAWMHYVYAKQGIVNGRWYDVVIPNSFDPADFSPRTEPGGDYLLFIGRLVQRKGPHVAAQIADRLGMKLVVAGPGATSVEKGRIVTDEVIIQANDLEYAGPVDKAERAELMAGAAACIVPTLYIEPFGGVNVEAMMSGTPVVASDFGAFTETVREGVSGYRFRTLQEGADAVLRATRLDRAGVLEYAQRYSIWNVRHEYDDWFRRVDGLWGEGWSA